MKQRIQYRTIRVTRARMYHQVAWFINDDDIFIFIDDIQRDILRFKTRFFFNLSVDGHLLATQYFFFRLITNFPLNQHALVEDPFFYSRT